MNHIFPDTFMVVFQGLVKIFLIGAVAGLLVWKKIIDPKHIDALSRITVYVLLPCLIFTTITRNFKPDELGYWWIIPLATAATALAGTGMAGLFYCRRIRSKKGLLPLASMQNAAYLILPIGEFVYPGQFDQFALYCFLVVLGINPVVWTFGKYLITGKSGSSWTHVITPPFVANILSILLVLTSVHHHIPVMVTDSVQFLGKATVPVATLILGATLAGSIRSLPRFSEAFPVMLVKFLVIPALVLLVIHVTGLHQQNKLLSDVLVIQSASAPATALILISRTYGGDTRKIGGIIFVGYIICMFAIPLWLATNHLLSP